LDILWISYKFSKPRKVYGAKVSYKWCIQCTWRMTLEKKLQQQKVYLKWSTSKVATSTMLLIELHTTQNSPHICPCIHFIFCILPIHFPFKNRGQFWGVVHIRCSYLTIPLTWPCNPTEVATTPCITLNIDNEFEMFASHQL